MVLSFSKVWIQNYVKFKLYSSHFKVQIVNFGYSKAFLFVQIIFCFLQVKVPNSNLWTSILSTLIVLKFETL